MDNSTKILHQYVLFNLYCYAKSKYMYIDKNIFPSVRIFFEVWFVQLHYVIYTFTFCSLMVQTTPTFMFDVFFFSYVWNNYYASNEMTYSRPGVLVQIQILCTSAYGARFKFKQ